jgi:hypothetical protein
VACLAAGGAKPPKSNLTIGHYLRWCKHSNYNWIGHSIGQIHVGRLDWTDVISSIYNVRVRACV